MSSINTIKLDPIIDPSKYQKIEITRWEEMRNFVCVILTLGLILAYQNSRFRDGLESGDLNKASKALRWSVLPHVALNREFIENLDRDGKTDSLLFASAQMDLEYVQYFSKGTNIEIAGSYHQRKMEEVHDALMTIPAIKKARVTQVLIQCWNQGGSLTGTPSPYLNVEITPLLPRA